MPLLLRRQLRDASGAFIMLELLSYTCTDGVVMKLPVYAGQRRRTLARGRRVLQHHGALAGSGGSTPQISCDQQ